jgi:predicted transcriptional regulator
LDVETESRVVSVDRTTEQTSLADMVNRMEKTCNACNPLSMLTCIAGCNIWKIKNQFRDTYKKMNDTDFESCLLNAIKNKERLQVLHIISKSHVTLTWLRQQLGKLDHHQSQRTIAEEYIQPLIDVGLAVREQGTYSATVFGRRLAELTKCPVNITDALPHHSECHEEAVLTSLLREPKTHRSLEKLLPAESIARTLSRLQSAGLIKTSEENDYVFFFKTQRNPSKETLSPTERKTYDSIPEDGISARRLAQETKITLRRTYKYLRRLKGKKLVFTREKPKSYALTNTGAQAATVIESTRHLIQEVFEAAMHVLNTGQTNQLVAATRQTTVAESKSGSIKD